MFLFFQALGGNACLSQHFENGISGLVFIFFVIVVGTHGAFSWVNKNTVAAM
jgi:hypothetical protein